MLLILLVNYDGFAIDSGGYKGWHTFGNHNVALATIFGSFSCVADNKDIFCASEITCAA